jgi:HEAT repeat protein
MLFLVFLVQVGAAQDASRDDASALVEKLRSDAPQTREAAARKLKDLGRAALPALEKASKDADAEVAASAAQILRVIRLRETFGPRLLAAVPGIDERLAAGPGPAWTAEFLKAADVARVAARGDVLRAADLAPLVEGALGGAARRDLIEVLRAIREFRLRAGTAGTAALLGQADAELRRWAILTLGVLGAKEHAPAIAKAAAAEGGDVANALAVLATLGAKDELLKFLREGPAPMRAEAVTSLGRMNAREAVPELLALLKDGDPDLRARALGALSDMGAAEALPGARALLEDAAAPVRQQALHALVALHDEGATPTIVSRLKDESPAVRGAALSALHDLRAKSAVPAIAGLLDDSDEEVRGLAVAVLGWLGGEEAVPRIAPLLRDPRPRTRVRAALALADLGVRSKAADIAAGLKDGDETVRVGTLDALGRLEARDRLTEVLKLLKDGAPAVRAAAADCTGKLGTAQTAASLVPLLSDAEEKTRLAAAQSLCVLGSTQGVEQLLSGGGDLSYLNALRRPQAWKRWQGKRLVSDARGSPRELVNDIARQAGVKADWSQAGEDADPTAYGRLSDWGTVGRSPLLELLREIRSGVVLEEEGLVLLRPEAEEKFWTDWWKREGGKQK